jgi:hypothetical protein
MPDADTLIMLHVTVLVVGFDVGDDTCVDEVVVFELCTGMKGRVDDLVAVWEGGHGECEDLVGVVMFCDRPDDLGLDKILVRDDADVLGFAFLVLDFDIGRVPDFRVGTLVLPGGNFRVEVGLTFVEPDLVEQEVNLGVLLLIDSCLVDSDRVFASLPKNILDGLSAPVLEAGFVLLPSLAIVDGVPRVGVDITCRDVDEILLDGPLFPVDKTLVDEVCLLEVFHVAFVLELDVLREKVLDDVIPLVLVEPDRLSELISFVEVAWASVPDVAVERGKGLDVDTIFLVLAILDTFEDRVYTAEEGLKSDVGFVED